MEAVGGGVVPGGCCSAKDGHGVDKVLVIWTREKMDGPNIYLELTSKAWWIVMGRGGGEEGKNQDDS